MKLVKPDNPKKPDISCPYCNTHYDLETTYEETLEMTGRINC